MSIRDRIPETSMMHEQEYFDCCIVGMQDGSVLYNADKMIDILVQRCHFDTEEAKRWILGNIGRTEQGKYPPRYFWEI